MKYSYIRVIVLAVFFVSVSILAFSQERMPLSYSGPVKKNGLEGAQEHINSRGHIADVSVAELLLYDVCNAKTLMLLIPGGAYKGIAIEYEGYKTAEWLNSNGIAAAVLKYRLPNGIPEILDQDIVAAMKMVKSYAVEHGYEKIGVMGFSAGGHLASMTLTKVSVDLRPDFAVLVYPVISMDYDNAGTVVNLCGSGASASVRSNYTTSSYVDGDTPPTFIVLTGDDKAVSPDNSILFYNALRSFSISSELHIFPEGNHGWWMRDRYKYGECTYTAILNFISRFNIM